ncbi:ABC transporter permease [Ruminiclostridium herbifermentans]|uniref:ABC transporter permease n=1 Tax=Ruminiclostridium herbifermentans TaxID=2488810 RepID=A0A7H1VM18_9FIRM|nr:FtsX-like permease family protein [Ruminiclostridium herbifermentans]QNU66430.1 ABC transporter permease [Ruminiclostridium herbifermentans]
MIKNSMKQILRMPVKSFSFLVLMVLAAFLLTLGCILYIMNNATITKYEDSFITIGTVEQKAFSVKRGTEWNAELKDYSVFQKAEYSSLLPSSILSFPGANYIHEPKKRSYYGSYAPDYILWNTSSPQNFPVVIAEISPIEDCIPDEAVKVIVKKVLFGDSALEGSSLWFCNHYTKNPKPLKKGNSYAVVLLTNYWAHGKHFEAEAKPEKRSVEYVPIELVSKQYDRNGKRMKDTLEGNSEEASPYYEIVNGFYETEIGKRVLNLIEGYAMLRATQPVTGTNATMLLMSFYLGDSYISQGRDISEEEYNQGDQVCLVSKEFAENNKLTLGDEVNLQLYFTNSKISSGTHNMEQWLPITVKGEVLSVFEESRYTIVGIYDTFSGANDERFRLALDEVIVPLASIKNQNSCNIMEYGPMKGSTTSFQIPNGSIDAYMANWEKYGTDELEIIFYDRGYTQLKNGLENIKQVSLLLLVVGMIMVLFLLLFFSHLFITNQKERIAIERCLGVEKKQCRSSLLSGILILLIAGSILGCCLGGVLSQHISADTMDRVYYDTTYSNVIATETKGTSDKVANDFLVVMIVVFSTGAGIALMGVLISVRKINRILNLEPMKLLSEKN